eukprot:5955443-Pleurochrysis_carterae.AAC.1
MPRSTPYWWALRHAKVVCKLHVRATAARRWQRGAGRPFVSRPQEARFGARQRWQGTPASAKGVRGRPTHRRKPRTRWCAPVQRACGKGRGRYVREGRGAGGEGEVMGARAGIG